jgi:hypothetical protein
VVILLIALAEAGCPVDLDADTRRAAAQIVVEGTVAAVVVSARAVETFVVVDTAHRGTVEGALIIESGMPNRVDVSPVVFPPGTRVQIIGSPIDGRVPFSPCNADVARAGAVELAPLAGPGPALVGHPVPAVQGLTLSAPETDVDVYVSGEPFHRTGDVLKDHEGYVDARLDAGGFRAALPIPDEALLPALGEDHEVGTLVFRAGTPLNKAGGLRVEGVSSSTVFPVSDRFVPAALPPIPAGECHWSSGNTDLLSEPGGEVLASLNTDSQVTLHTTGRHKDGHEQVELHSFQVQGSAWVVSGHLVACGGGGFGYGTIGGAISNTDPIEMKVPEGAELRRPGQKEPFAVAGRYGGELLWLATEGKQALVVLEHPGGTEVAWVDCPEDGCPR